MAFAEEKVHTEDVPCAGVREGSVGAWAVRLWLCDPRPHTPTSTMSQPVMTASGKARLRANPPAKLLDEAGQAHLRAGPRAKP